MATLGLGSLFFCYLLFRTARVPRKLAAWGFIGYAVFAVGMVLDLFGFGVGLLLTIPGGLFELVFATWLIVKGFRPSATAPATAEVDGATQESEARRRRSPKTPTAQQPCLSCATSTVPEIAVDEVPVHVDAAGVGAACGI